jgi:chemotaxis-related protein WspB
LIGLIAERVAGTLQREEKDFVNVGVETVAAPYLGPIVMDAQGIIQILDAQKLLDAGAHQLQLTDAPETSDAPH